MTVDNAGVLIPRPWIGVLQEMPPVELAMLEVWPDGSAIALEDRGHPYQRAWLADRGPARDAAAAALATMFAHRNDEGTSDAK